MQGQGLIAPTLNNLKDLSRARNRNHGRNPAPDNANDTIRSTSATMKTSRPKANITMERITK